MSRVGENIKKVRETSGMSTKALAKKMGVSEGFLLEVEQGRRVLNESMIQRFTAILGKNVSEVGLDSFESAVFKEEKEVLRQTRVKAEPVKPAEKSAPPVKNELWDQAFGSNLKNVPIYALDFQQPVNHKLYPVEAGKVGGILADKAVLVRQDTAELSGYGIFRGSLLLGSPVKALTQDGFYLVTIKGKNLIRKIHMLGNANVLLLQKTDRELTESVSLKDVKPLLHFIRVETAI